MIIFVGDEPSAKNIDPNVPFVGTQSYKRLLGWIWEMDINISDVTLLNQNKLDINYVNGDVYYDRTFIDNECNITFIALGKKAAEKLDGSYVRFFDLPHPSGRNRKLNDKKYVKQILKQCKEWLNE